MSSETDINLKTLSISRQLVYRIKEKIIFIHNLLLNFFMKIQLNINLYLHTNSTIKS